jgi:hypothetical protein
MIQRRDGAGFALKSFAEFLRRSFDGDNPVEPHIASLPDLAHASCADGREDFVGPEFVAG